MVGKRVAPMMFNDDSSKVQFVEIVANVLNQALHHLYEHDYASAQVMVAIARQVLEDLQQDLDRHLQIEEMLKQFLDPSFK